MRGEAGASHLGPSRSQTADHSPSFFWFLFRSASRAASRLASNSDTGTPTTIKSGYPTIAIAVLIYVAASIVEALAAGRKRTATPGEPH